MHPDYWAQLAQRNCLLQTYNSGSIIPGQCVISSTGVTAGGEPNMKLRRVHGYSASEGSATGKGHVFSIGTASVTCETATFKWSQPSFSSTISVTPEYSKCSDGGLEAKVTTKECRYIFAEPSEGEAHEAKVILPEGCHLEIVITFSGECRIKAEGLQELKEVGLKNLNTTKGSYEGEVKANVAGIAYKSEGTICELGGVPKEGKAEYKGIVVEKGVIVE
jgi:hypothetical protein